MKEYLGKNGLRALVDNVKAWANGAFTARAFAKVKVGSAVVQASDKEDALNLVAGENVTISAQGSSVTISTQGGASEYETATTERDGLMSKGDKANLDEVKGWYDTAVGGSEVGSAIDKWHDVTEFLSGISDNDTLKGILDAITREVETLKSDVMTGSVVAGKADALNVRSAVGGASKPVYINGNGFAEVCSYDLKDISDAANSAMAKASAAYVKPSGGIPKTDLASGVQSSLDKADGAQPLITDLETIRTRASNGNSAFIDLSNGVYAKNADLAKVAKSGSYADLTNKPTIPDAVTVDATLSASSTNPVQNKVINSALAGKQATISDISTIRSGAAKGATAYQKPTTGIPRGDLNSAITEELDSKLEAGDVGNGTITLNGSNGSTLGSFTTNQASNTAITIPVTSVSNSSATLSWGEAVTLAKVNGTAITAKLPSNPAKTYKAGEGLYESTANTFAVSAATTSAMGGMKVGYTANGKKYPVSVDGGGNAFVEVPWSADGGNAAHVGGKDVDALQNLMFNGDNARYIPVGTDLDTLYGEDKCGFWNSYDNTEYTNCPIMNFGLLVVRINTSYFAQLLLPFDSGGSEQVIRYRAQYYDNVQAKWNAWRKIVRNEELEKYIERSASEVFLGNRGNIGTDDVANLPCGLHIATKTVGGLNPIPLPYSSVVNFGNLYYTPQMCVKHDCSQIWFRNITRAPTGNELTDWKEVAFKNDITDGNIVAGNALKLEGTPLSKIHENVSFNSMLIGDTEGWYRIAHSIDFANSPRSFILFLERQYGYDSPESYVFSISNTMGNYFSITQLSGVASTRLIDKIRVVNSASISDYIYVDIHVNPASGYNNRVFWGVVGNAEAYNRDSVVFNPELTGVNTEFETVNGFKANNNIYEGDTALSDKYLPSSGGTITGDLNINSETDTTRRYFRMWYYAAGRRNRGLMAVDENNVYLSYYSPDDRMNYMLSAGRNGLKFEDAGVEKTILHSGNVGDYAALTSNALSAQSNNGGVKVQLGGTIGTPTLTVTTTTGGVNSSNTGVVSGSEVYGFVKDSKLELKRADGGTIGTFTTNQAQGTAITFSNASTSTAGLMSAADKTKLNSAVAGSGVTNIQVVSALPSNPDSNTLYIIK